MHIKMQSSTDATERTLRTTSTTRTDDDNTQHDDGGTRPKRKLDELERKLRLNLVGALTTTTS